MSPSEQLFVTIDDIQRVQLEPNSLFIATQLLPIPNRFHWSIYITCNDGLATRHEWAQNGTMARGIDKLVAAEKYERNEVPKVTTYFHGIHCMLAYFKLEGYRPVPDSTGLDENKDKHSQREEIAREIYENAFPDSYHSVFENRKNNLTCRTWVFKVLETLQKNKIIFRLPEKPIMHLESVIIERSMLEEARLASLHESEEFTSAVITI